MLRKLEAVSICVGYADFLQETVKHNAQLFDRWVIVTSDEDGETKEVCRRWSLPTLLTEEFYRDGAEFNKGRAVALGMDQIEGNDWIIHVDSDVILPPDFRNWLNRANLEESKVYGFDRVMVQSWDQWQQLKNSGYLQHDYHCRCNFPKGFEVGSRWVSTIHSWVPIGFAQLFHGSADTSQGFHQKPYPGHHNIASRSDVQFSLQWDRRKRELLPEVIAIHLESEPARLGANWKGRTTKRFGPPAHPSSNNAGVS